MCLLLQILLSIGATGSAAVLRCFLSVPLWAAGIGGFAFLGIAWFGYLRFQAKHSQWYPPWDEGLPQHSRMLNAFVPAAGVFLLALLMMPTFQKLANAKPHRVRHKIQHNPRSTEVRRVGLKSYAVGRRRLVSAFADKE